MINLGNVQCINVSEALDEEFFNEVVRTTFYSRPINADQEFPMQPLLIDF